MQAQLPADNASAAIGHGFIQELPGRGRENVGRYYLRVLRWRERADADLPVHRRVPDIVELRPEFHRETLVDLGVLDYVDVPILEAAGSLAVAAGISGQAAHRCS